MLICIAKEEMKNPETLNWICTQRQLHFVYATGSPKKTLELEDDLVTFKDIVERIKGHLINPNM